MSSVSRWFIILDHLSCGLWLRCFCRSLDWDSNWTTCVCSKWSQGYLYCPFLMLHLIPNGDIFSPFIWPRQYTFQICSSYPLPPLTCPLIDHESAAFVLQSKNSSIICFFRGKIIWSLTLLCLIKCLPRNISLQEVRMCLKWIDNHLSSLLCFAVSDFAFWSISALFSSVLLLFVCMCHCSCSVLCFIYYCVIYSVTPLPSVCHM